MHWPRTSPTPGQSGQNFTFGSVQRAFGSRQAPVPYAVRKVLDGASLQPNHVLLARRTTGQGPDRQSLKTWLKRTPHRLRRPIWTRFRSPRTLCLVSLERSWTGLSSCKIARLAPSGPPGTGPILLEHYRILGVHATWRSHRPPVLGPRPSGPVRLKRQGKGLKACQKWDP